jgi:hypothetical protein
MDSRGQLRALTLACVVFLAGLAESTLSAAQQADAVAPSPPASAPVPPLATAPAAPAPVSPAPAAAPAGAPSPSTVRLVEAGAEPRAPLRYQAVVGAREAMMVTTRTRTDIDMGFGPQVTRLPTTRVMVEIGPVGDAGAGRLMVPFNFTALEVQPTDGVSADAVARMQRDFSPLVGLQGFQLIDRQGLGTGVDIVIPPGTPTALSEQIQALRRNLHDLFAPFPAEPVGVGAVWEVRTQLLSNHVMVDQVTTYRLTAHAGEEVSLTVTFTQSAGSQALPSPQPGVDARLESLQGTGTGTMELKLSHLTPANHLLTRAMGQSTVSTAGFTQNVRMGMDLEVWFGLP